MRYYLFIVISILLFGCNKQTAKDNLKRDEKVKSFYLDSTYLFKAQPLKGFNFDYYLYIPKGLDQTKENTILIESTNTGVSDSIEHHANRAKYAASKSSVGNYVSNKLQIPLLVPIFPRSETNWQMYSHAFDSETFNEKGTDLERLDLQLLAMFEDAKSRLFTNGLKIQDKFFMTGFSASGTFANRFSILHPHKIKAVCAGGLNSILILPLEQYKGESLDFPIGIGDVESRTGKKADLHGFRSLPQFWFMGENDKNDAAKFDDGYNPTERKWVYEILGEEMMPERWESVQQIYLDNDIPALFKTYKGIGHGTDRRINNEISIFFERYLK
ncbi:hypothetical protein [Tenacibaculum aiptasiae]|uniref:hypothetical protein n=1 Tax=Tenacibaculum aiptasiae TaxID=426481 RepID=UPI00232EAE66|nr:hypothetical protein [Tenacibaculum aiptasiae]